MLLFRSGLGAFLTWEWKIASYPRPEGVATIAPRAIDQAQRVCPGGVMNRELARSKCSKFLAHRDRLREGPEPETLEHFYC